MRQYVFSIICTAMLCAVVSALIQSNHLKKGVKLLCAVVLILTAVNPVCRLDINEYLQIDTSYEKQAEAFSSKGIAMAQEALSDIIKENTEAYILDKAKELGSCLSVEITVGPDYLPNSSSISGERSPSVKKQIERILEKDIGIARENQQWRD